VSTRGDIKDHSPRKRGTLAISPAARAEWLARLREADLRNGDGCSLDCDSDGYYCYTHRASSGRYPSPGKIPLDQIRFVGSTS
jgi:hypothetical protein